MKLPGVFRDLVEEMVAGGLQAVDLAGEVVEGVQVVELVAEEPRAAVVAVEGPRVAVVAGMVAEGLQVVAVAVEGPRVEIVAVMGPEAGAGEEGWAADVKEVVVEGQNQVVVEGPVDQSQEVEVVMVRSQEAVEVEVRTERVVATEERMEEAMEVRVRRAMQPRCLWSSMRILKIEKSYTAGLTELAEQWHSFDLHRRRLPDLYIKLANWTHAGHHNLCSSVSDIEF